MKYKIINELVFISFDIPFNEATRITREMMNMPFEEDAFIRSRATHTVEIDQAPTKEIISAVIEAYTEGMKKVLPNSNMHFVSLTFKRVEAVIE